MRRALIALPLLALLLGLLLFLLHRGGTPDAPARPASPGSDGAPPAVAAESKAPAPAPAAAAPDPTLSGGIKIIVTYRGQPVAAAPVVAQREGTPDFMKFKTEADGTQILRGMPLGEFSFRVDHPDYVPQIADQRIEPGKIAEVKFELFRGGRIYGTVTDPSGRPVPDARIFLLAISEKPTPMPGTAVQSDAKGQYEIKRITGGTYGIRFRHNRFEPLDRLDMSFTAPTDEYRVDVVLTPGARITGRVIDEQGKPIPGAHVQASNILSAMTGFTDSEGNFDLGGLFSKPANFEATKEGFGRVVLRNLPADGPPVEVRLPKAGSVIGRVIADQPLPEFMILLSRYDEELKQVIQPEFRQFQKSPGNVFNLTNVAPGSYWVEIHAEGYEASDKPQIQVVGGQITEGVTLTLRKKN